MLSPVAIVVTEIPKTHRVAMPTEVTVPTTKVVVSMPEMMMSIRSVVMMVSAEV